MTGGKSQDLPVSSILSVVCPHCRMMIFWGFREILTAATCSLFVLIDVVMGGSMTDLKLWTSLLSLMGPAPEDNPVLSLDPDIVVDIYS